MDTLEPDLTKLSKLDLIRLVMELMRQLDEAVKLVPGREAD